MRYCICVSCSLGNDILLFPSTAMSSWSMAWRSSTASDIPACAFWKALRIRWYHWWNASLGAPVAPQPPGIEILFWLWCELEPPCSNMQLASFSNLSLIFFIHHAPMNRCSITKHQSFRRHWQVQSQSFSSQFLEWCAKYCLQYYCTVHKTVVPYGTVLYTVLYGTIKQNKWHWWSPAKHCIYCVAKQTKFLLEKLQVMSQRSRSPHVATRLVIASNIEHWTQLIVHLHCDWVWPRGRQEYNI